MNWIKRLSWIIFFLFIIFNATIIPVYISRAKLTEPNLPYPKTRIILKFYLLSPFGVNFILSGDLVWLRKKDGSIFYDLWASKFYVAVVEVVYFRFILWLVLPPEFLALKKFYCYLEVPFLIFAIFYQL